MTRSLSLTAALVVVLSLAGCAGGGGSIPVTPIDTIPEEDPSNPYLTASELKAKLAGYTRLSVMPIHGPQVEYNAEDGATYLWYPGNKIVLKGGWKVEPSYISFRDGPNATKAYRIPAICYLYGSNTYNPATRKKGGDWKCQAYVMSEQFDKGAKKGDIFGLAKSTTPPYILTKDDAAINKLKARFK